MIEIRIPVDVPESRAVTVTLPPETPTGPNELTVRVHFPDAAAAQSGLPANGPPTSLRDDKWSREYQAFLRLLPDLLKTHRGQYVAIHEGQVVGADRDKIALACRIRQQFPKVPVCIRQVVEQPPPAIRMPSFRLARQGA